MKFLSFRNPSGVGPCMGVLLGDGRIFDVSSARLTLGFAKVEVVPHSLDDLIKSNGEALEEIRKMLSDPALQRYVWTAEDITFLPPITPSRNIFCVGRNYREHIIEGNIANGRPANSFPEAIEFFTKPPTAVVAHGQPVRRHAALTASLDYEAELAIVIGRRGVDIPEAQALDYVFGYTIVNDVTARDLQRRHGQWFKGKSLDTSCPLGPVIVHHAEIGNPNKLRVELDVNQENRQDANTDEMIFSVQSIIAQLSAGMTLEPGDIISTGTPKGVGFAAIPQRCLNVGDVMTIRVEGIGELTNTIVD